MICKKYLINSSIALIGKKIIIKAQAGLRASAHKVENVSKASRYPNMIYE